MSGSVVNNQRLCFKLDKTDETILRYQHQPSIKLIKKRFADLPIFNSRAVSVTDIKGIIMQFKTYESVSGKILVKLLKDCNFSFHVFTNCINESIENGTFPNSLTEVNITPVCKFKNLFDNVNYRPMTMLLFIFKVYKRQTFNQLSNHAKTF